MGNGFQFFDIILFAMIAVFLILRLRGVLGRRDGHEGGLPDIFDRLMNQGKKPGADNTDPENNENGENVVKLTDNFSDTDFSATATDQTPLAAGISAITSVDRQFDINEFVSGARMAFEMILRAYASGDSATLRPLLGDEAFANFDRSIRERETAGQTMEETLVSIRSAEAVEADLEGAEAQITVKLVSEQVHALFDKDGTAIEGDPNLVITVTDFWTFVRNTKAKDPNWTLVATRSLD